jgi:hypothetical protein
VSAFAISMASHDVSSKASGPAVTSFTGRHLTTTRVAQAPLSLHPPASHAHARPRQEFLDKYVQYPL